jgi:predicted CoA-substrate-specific enzyme activase
MFTLGIDVGSTTSKCVILKDGKVLVAKSLVAAGTGTHGPDAAFEEVFEKAGIKYENIDYTVVTGYGRKNYVKANENKSELSCHAKGVAATTPDARTIIDIGGQDAKVIYLDDNGLINNFIMNDKCAAGTGRFLDVMSAILHVDINDFGKYALKSEVPTKISSTCTVFAESEVISQLSNGVKMDDLIAGICQSVASRTATLAKRGRIKSKIYMSGGVAQNQAVRNALGVELKEDVHYVENAQYMGAWGAAIIAYEKISQ